MKITRCKLSKKVQRRLLGKNIKNEGLIMYNQDKFILHITNDYSGSTVYKNLVVELDKLGIIQTIYTPINSNKESGLNWVDFKEKKSSIIYSPILNKYFDRMFYPIKIFKILADIQSKVDFDKIKIIHAHTWYSDGGVAYFLSKKYNIPFIVTIRNTDLNIFQKKLIYLRPFGKRILMNAKQILLISASYETKVLSQSSLRKCVNKIKDKIRIIPNGVDPYWIENSLLRLSIEKDNVFNVLYVGKFTTGKQVPMLQKAIIQLNNELSQKIVLHIVGGIGSDEDEVIDIVEKYPNIFKFYGQINDKSQLISVFRSCDMFAMPSRHETFGLVYVEAMLQSLPILYTEGEGIDGFYSEKIGEKIVSNDVEEIKKKLKTMVISYENYLIPLEKIKQSHDWTLIAKKYQKIYRCNI